MSENKHYEWATAAFSAVAMNSAPEFQSECRDDAMIQATLAAAYEQRTTNLIAWFRHVDHQGDLPDHAADLAREIFERLGMDADQ
jgi:hypothetical protein